MSRKRKKKRQMVPLSHAVIAVILSCILTALATVGIMSRKDTGAISTSMAVTASDETLRGTGYTVCLDAGHGGEDGGAEGGGYVESDDTLQITLLVQEALEAEGVTVVMTRTDDTYLSLEDRVTTAEQAGADALVSLHRNTSEDASVDGAEIWIYSAEPENSLTLAACILSSIADSNTLSTSRGVKSGTIEGDGDYYINSYSSMASCIVELGFMTNTQDNQIFHNKMEKIAQAVADGILDALEAGL